MHSPIRVAFPPGVWRRGKALLRLFLLLAAAAAIAEICVEIWRLSRLCLPASVAAVRCFGRALPRSGHALGNASETSTWQPRRRLDGGSVENITRLTEAGRGCVPAFALVQDGIPVPADAGLEMLGRLPEPESLLFLGRHDHAFLTFADLQGASIGIGPEGSGTAYLLRQLFEDPDLRGLGVRLSNTSWRTRHAWSARESWISLPS